MTGSERNSRCCAGDRFRYRGRWPNLAGSAGEYRRCNFGPHYFLFGSRKCGNILNPAPKEFWNKLYFESREISKPVKLSMKKAHSIIEDVSFGQLQAA